MLNFGNILRQNGVGLCMILILVLDLSWNISNFEENTLSFALNPNGPGWPNPPWSPYYRKLITNINFRNQFINRYADELNTRFLPTNIITCIDQMAIQLLNQK